MLIGELDALVELVDVEREVRDQIDASFLAAEMAGYSQQFIARELGITQQAVQKRIARAKASPQAQQVAATALAAFERAAG